MELNPIGTVRSALKTRAEAPHQGPPTGIEAVLELRPEYAEGLTGMKPGDYVWVLCHFDRADQPQMLVHPQGNPENPLRGVFLTRAPSRPNPISLTLVEVLEIHGASLRVRGLEMLDGTPLLDIKVYAAGLDQPRKGKKS